MENQKRHAALLNLIENAAVPPHTVVMSKSVFTGPVYVVRDNIDTDQIISAQYLNLVPTIAEEYEKLGSYALDGLPASLYPTRYVEAGQLDSKYPIVVAGKNFGCGSSREHAAMCPMYLGVKAIVAKSFARIHHDNLVNFGLVPLTFANEADYNMVEPEDTLEVQNIRQLVWEGAGTVAIQNVSKGTTIVTQLNLLPRLRQILLAGGLLNYVGQAAEEVNA